MYTNEQKEFAQCSHEEAEESLRRIIALFSELDEEVEKWLAHPGYEIANKASGGWLTKNEAIKKLGELYSKGEDDG